VPNRRDGVARFELHESSQYETNRRKERAGYLRAGGH
jgi:hypothetical protein